MLPLSFYVALIKRWPIKITLIKFAVEKDTSDESTVRSCVDHEAHGAIQHDC